MNVKPIAFGLVLLGAAAAADRFAPVPSPAPLGVAPTAPSGGVLSCPVATTGRGDATLYLANVGEEIGRARIFLRTTKNSIITRRVGLAAGQIERIRLDELTREPSGLAIEWSGGRVVAAHSLHSERRQIVPGRQLPRFMSAAQCLEAMGPELVVAGARTDHLGDTTLSVFNPGPAPADISIGIRSGGEYSFPERLQGRIIRPLSRRDFSLRNFAFGASEVAAVIRMTAGRVVAEAYVENRGGAELISAVPPLAEAIAISPVGGGEARLSLASAQQSLSADETTGSPVEAAIPLNGTRFAGSAVEAPGELPPALGPGTPGRVAIPAPEGAAAVGYDLRPMAGRIAAGTSWRTEGRRGGYDLAATSAAAPAQTWFGVVPGFGDDWRVDLYLAASAGQSATAELRVFGPDRRSESVEIRDGAVRRVTIGTGNAVHAIAVTSDVPLGAAIVGRSGGIAYGSIPSTLRAAAATALSRQPVVGIGHGSP